MARIDRSSRWTTILHGVGESHNEAKTTEMDGRHYHHTFP